MTAKNRRILVFGATGQQGGSVARALLGTGWKVRAFVRDPESPAAQALRAAGAELARGVLADHAAIAAAMEGVHGVFSVQPSSGQGAMYGVTDAQEAEWGQAIGDLATVAGVSHLVYSSSNAVGDQPTGMGHFDSKASIEAHLRSLPVPTTIIRPATFMEMLVMPGFGLPEGCFTFFMWPGQPMQVLAVRDIGLIVAAIFTDPVGFVGRTLDIASDSITGEILSEAFTECAGRPITYRRFPDATLAGNPFLASLTRLVDAGRLSGQADLAALRALVPGLQSFRTWLAGDGHAIFATALGTGGEWSYGTEP